MTPPRSDAGAGAPGLGACPPAVEYCRSSWRGRPRSWTCCRKGSAILELLSDYAVMREKVQQVGEPTRERCVGDPCRQPDGSLETGRGARTRRLQKSGLPIRSAMAATMARPSPLPSVLALARSKRAVRRSRVSRGRTGPSFATINSPVRRQGHLDRSSLRAVTQRVLHEVPAQDPEGVGVEVRHDRRLRQASARCGPARPCARYRPPRHARRPSDPRFGPGEAARLPPARAA